MSTNEPLIPNENYFEQEIRDFVNQGQLYRLQRFMIAAGSRKRAELVAKRIIKRLGEIIEAAIPPEEPSAQG